MSARLTVLLFLVGCSGGTVAPIDAAPPDASIPDASPPDALNPDDAPDAAPDATPPDAAWTYHHYVTNSLRVGATPSEADSFGFPLDTRPPTRDNRIGKLLANFSATLMMDAKLAADVTSGAIVNLQSLLFVDDHPVSWQVYVGAPVANPDLGGYGVFSIAGDAPLDGKLAVRFDGGTFTAGPGSLTLAFAPGIRLRLRAARIQATPNDTGLTGKIGGGLSPVDVDEQLMPWFAAQLDGLIAADEGCRQNKNDCSPESVLLLGIFDVDQDRIISVTEVRNNDAIKGVLVPDVDLLTATGALGTDGVNDSVSIGFGFTCVGAVFTSPVE